MSEAIRIPTSGPLSASVRPPGSKSITNRAILCAALARGHSTLHGALDSEDTRLMATALQQLGVRIDADWSSNILHVDGCDGNFPVRNADLFAGNSGTTIRFLTAAVSLIPGTFRLSGTPRMHQRPIGDLLHGLRQLGVRAQAISLGDCPPVVIESTGWTGGSIDVAAHTSSQFVSGLMLAAPYATNQVELRIGQRVVSRPYLDLTADVMTSFGAHLERSGDRIAVSNRHRYRGGEFWIEPDASAASYFLAAAAIAGGTITIDGLTRRSRQGDLRFADLLQQMGCLVDWASEHLSVRGGPLVGIDADLSDCSDLVPTLAAVALFAAGPTTIRGVGHVRAKESDRIADLACELRKLGATVDQRPDGLRIQPGASRGADLDPHDDHRLAMGLAVAGLRIPGVVIRNPECVAKTYPRFFEDLARVTSPPSSTT